MRLKHLLFTFALTTIFLIAGKVGWGQTVLNPGDIAIIGMNADAPDGFSFVTFVDLEAGTEIRFTDSGVTAAGTFRSGEGAIKYTAPSLISAGSIIVCTDITNLSSEFVADNDATVGTNGVNFSGSGDQLIAFQGISTSPTFIFALNMDGVWAADATSSNNSAIPTGLVDGVSALAISPEVDNAVYNMSTTSGTVSELKAVIVNLANWTTNDASAQTLPSGSFTIGADATAPTAVYTPAPNATGVDITANVTVNYYEHVYKTDGSEIEDGATGVITLRKLGVDIPFALTIDANKELITINPTSNLDFSSTYNVSASVEDAAGNESVTSINFTTRAAYSNVTVTSSIYTVDDDAGTITNVPMSTSLGDFKTNLTPATGATFEVYTDGTYGTVATDLQTGYVVKVTAENGSTTKDYTITLNTTASTDASVASSVYTVSTVEPYTIIGVPWNESLTTFKDNLSPALGAAFKVYTDGTYGTVATDLQTGYVVKVTAEDKTTTRTYAITLDPHIIVTSPNLVTDKYYAGQNVTITWTQHNMASENVKIEAYIKNASGVLDWVEIAASTEGDGTFDYTIPSDVMYSNACKVRVTGVVSTTATDESDAAFSIVAIASNITNLKAFADNDIVKLTGEAVISFIRTANRNHKYIQDADAGILIDDNSAVITGSFNIGDGITGLEGKLSTYSGVRQFLPQVDPGTASSTGNTITPVILTVDELKTTYLQYQSMLVKVVDVVINEANGTATFAESSSCTIQDGAAVTATLRQNWKAGETDLIGSVIPSGPLAVSGIGTVFSSAGQISPRTTADLVSMDATLTDLKVNDVTVTGFDAATLIYNVELPFGAAVPAVAATATSTSATIDITQATVVDGGVATVLVTAQDGLTTKTYTINFTQAAAKTDATLSALTVNGIDVLAYDGLVVDPSTEPGATMWFNNFTDAMGIVATQNDADATVSIKKNDVEVVDPANEPLADNDVILITVTAQDVAVVKYYKITLQQKPIITATAGENGTIDPAGAVAVDYDGTKAFTATAASGYHIAALNVNGTPVAEAANQTEYTYTFNNVVADATIAATFEITKYTVTFTVKEGTTPLEGATVALAGYPNQTTNASGVATFTDVVPNLLAYTVTLDGYNKVEGNVTVEGNKNVDIAMVLSTTPTYSVIFTVKEGDVAVEAATVTLTGYGEQQTDATGVATFTGVPASIDVAYTVNKIGFVEATGAVTVVDADVNQAVALTRISYTIAASADENGTITPTGDVSVAHGNNQAFDVEAAAGYHIASLLVNGTEVAEAAGVASYTYTFNDVVADATIAATFAINSYTITVTAGENGTTTPATNQTVNHGGEVVFSIAANEGYHIKDVLVDGVSVGAVASYTFTNVTVDASIETQFEVNTYTIATLVSPVDAGTVTGAGDYTHGQEVTLTATANTGYAFEKWTVGGTTLSTSATYVFTAAENVEVTAVFVQQVTDLFFSESIEGAGNNKGFEIYNPTSSAIGLANYRIAQAANGGGWSTEIFHTFPENASIAAGDVWVIITNEVSPDLFDKANADEILAYPSVAHHTGNDARALQKTENGTDWVTIDVFGDPTSSVNFDVAGVTGAAGEHTLVRKGSVTSGNTDWAASAGTDADNSEWIVYPQNTFTYLGTHSTALSSAAEITFFSLAEQVAAATIDATSGTVTIEVVYGTDLTGLVSTFTVSAGAKAYVNDVLQVSGTTANNFTNEVVYKVVAEDGTIKEWTVTVTMPAQPSTAAEIVSFVLAEQTGAATINSAAGTIAIEVNSTANLAALAPTIEVSAGASISPASGAVQDFTNPVTYTVTAQDNNTTKPWTVTVTKPQVNVVTIAQIQQPTGDTGDSPYADQIVQTTGIVTAIQAGKGFFIQDGEGAWSGILVYTNTATGLPAIGDEVKVKGWLKEYYNYTEITNNTSPAVTVETTVLSTGNTLPAATVLTSQAVQAEEYEGVLVKVVSAEVISGPSDKQEYIVNDGSGELTVDDKLFLATFTVGTRYSITGVMDYSFDAFKLLPREASDVATGINDVKWGVNLEVYPNPFTSTISFSNVEDVELITVTNLIGQRVMTVKPESSNSINTDNLIKGIYLVSFQNRDGKVVVKKMIKQ